MKFRIASSIDRGRGIVAVRAHPVISADELKPNENTGVLHRVAGGSSQLELNVAPEIAAKLTTGQEFFLDLVPAPVQEG
jgi:hypothetical protein